MKFHQRVLFGSLSVAAPLAFLLPGCSGGSGGFSPSPTAQPTTSSTPTATAGPTATPTQAGAQSSNITLGNGQRAILTTRTSGTALTGTLQILSPLATAGRKARAFTFNIGVGTYAVTGTFTPPRGYVISGNFGTAGTFNMSGQLPTTTDAGSYSLSFNGQTETGIVPKIGQTFPTPVPTASTTPLPTATPGGQSGLTFTPSSGSNFVGAPLTNIKFTLVNNAGILGAAAQSDVAIGKNGVFLTFSGLKPTVGSVFNIKAIFITGYIYNYTPAGLIRNFVPESGTITVTAISQNSATVKFTNAVYAANEGSLSTGKVTVNGTLTGPLTRL